MTTKVEKSILVNVPVGTAYNQWTQFEDFPQFMGGVKTVTQIDDKTMHWVAEIGGVKREWDATILEQVPDQKVAWAATSGATNAGAIYFESVSVDQTSLRLELEYEPEGLLEKVGDKLNIVEKQAEGDLERFKAFIESEGYATGAWRGSVNEGAAVGTPGVESAASSQGDSGKAGLSAKTVIGAAAVAAAGVAAAAKAKGSNEETETVDVTPEVAIEPVAVEPVVVEPVDYPVETATYSDVDVTTTGDSTLATSFETGAAPVAGTPALSGVTGTPGVADPYVADDQAVTDFDETHRNDDRMAP